jgi:hypothetical protein
MANKKLTHIAKDQYGDTYKLYTKFPRKELLEKFGASHADKIYQDDKNGNSYHIGYRIFNLWLALYKIEPFKKPIGGQNGR